MKFLRSIVQYFSITLLGALTFILVRYLEYFLTDPSLLTEDSLSFLWKYSIHYDVFFAFQCSILFLPIFLLIELTSKFSGIASTIYKIFWSLLLTLNVLLTYFFLSSHYLLSEVIFHYSWEELMHIIHIDSDSSGKSYWLLYLLIPLSIGIYFWLTKKIKTNSKIVLYSVSILYLFIVLIITKNWKNDGKEVSHFDNQYAYYLGTSKPNFFLSSIYTSFQEKRDVSFEELSQAIISYQKDFKNREFTSLEFPLLHKSEFNNVLGPYFSKSKQKPNIVFIISEGLSAGFCGLHPTTQSLTPFIDSLARNGLYWSNFLSNCNRTFGVLPNVLGSLPNATMERGFMNFDGSDNYSMRYPKHSSLLTDLKKNGYQTSFHYGGWGDFDNMKSFVIHQEIDQYVDQTLFDSSKYLAPWKRIPKGLCWGYDDLSLFNQWFDNSKKIKSPYVSTLLTLNMHDPYNLSPKSYTNKKAVLARLKSMQLEKSHYSTQDPLILGSIFYYEDALKKLINTYKKRADYKNTIFILFGDHYSFVSYLNNPLDVYHIPFIIFSPLIKQAKQFDAVSTHLDIAPSLTALLRGNYQMKFSNTSHYLGSGLDTSSTFQTKKIVPFNPYNKNNYPFYLFEKYVITQEGVFEIFKDLQLKKVNDKKKIASVQKHLKNYKMIDRYVCEKNKITK
jgi:phosphoglycerol transferase MdoB-like AlkP superfamily enzyme